LKAAFSGIRLSDVSAEYIEEYKEARLAEGVEPATVNHDLRVLRRMMRLAERKRLISWNPFLEVDFLKQRNLRPPHIVTFEEEEKILAVAPSFLRVLVVLILETGMRSHREALALMWDAINFANDSVRVKNRKPERASETFRLQQGAKLNSCVGERCSDHSSHRSSFPTRGPQQDEE
jgi:integrase